MCFLARGHGTECLHPQSTGACMLGGWVSPLLLSLFTKNAASDNAPPFQLGQIIMQNFGTKEKKKELDSENLGPYAPHTPGSSIGCAPGERNRQHSLPQWPNLHKQNFSFPSTARRHKNINSACSFATLDCRVEPTPPVLLPLQGTCTRCPHRKGFRAHTTSKWK